MEMKESLPADPGQRIALLVKQKRLRDGLGVIQAAKACGVCASTISRIENLKLPNLPDGKTLLKLGKWLETTVGVLLGEEVPVNAKNTHFEALPPEILEIHLKADKSLHPTDAKALAEVFKLMYYRSRGRF